MVVSAFFVILSQWVVDATMPRTINDVVVFLASFPVQFTLFFFLYVSLFILVAPLRVRRAPQDASRNVRQRRARSADEDEEVMVAAALLQEASTFQGSAERHDTDCEGNVRQRTGDNLDGMSHITMSRQHADDTPPADLERGREAEDSRDEPVP